MTVKNYIDKLLAYKVLVEEEAEAKLNGVDRTEIIMDTDKISQLDDADKIEVKKLLFQIIKEICNNETEAKAYNVADFKCLHYQVTTNTSMEIAKIYEDQLRTYLTLSVQKLALNVYFDMPMLEETLSVNGKEEKDTVLAHFVLSQYLSSDEVAEFNKEGK